LPQRFEVPEHLRRVNPFGRYPTPLPTNSDRRASLTSQCFNISIRNSGFPVKRPHHAKSDLKITQALPAVEEWNEDQIAVRPDGFAAMAPTLWPLLLP